MKRRKRGVKKGEIKPRWEEDYELVDNEGLFGEYLEMSKKFSGHMYISLYLSCSRSLLYHPSVIL